ncbi:MAG: tetratricopeptide repeat protein [Geobacteraceae bacterium]|nr:tetratricopeptide repeat protein [Geobacteraceae bacterium]
MGNSQFFNKALAKHNAGKFEEAIRLYKTALMKAPMHLDANYLLGTLYSQTGRFDEGKKYLLKAEKIMPTSPFIKVNLGIVHKEQGDYEAALLCFNRALELHPDFPEAYCNLGKTYNDLGRLEEAEHCYVRAIEIRPDFAEAYNNLALLLNKQGKSAMALDIIRKSLNIMGTDSAKSIFVACLNRQEPMPYDKELQEIMVRALTETWGRPSCLEKISTMLIKQNPDSACIGRAVAAWPLRLSAQDLFGGYGISTVPSDELLLALLVSSPVCDTEMERFLTLSRTAMLELAAGSNAADVDVDSALGFFSALARQCFINEYLFSYGDEEIKKATNLRDRLASLLEAGDPVPDLLIITVASYFPLSSLSPASRLLDGQRPDEVAAVLQQQVREPFEESQLRASIPRLTTIQDEVSIMVQNQYEENPYPRWVNVTTVVKPKNIDQYISQKFPNISFNHYGKSGDIDILVAGCGTGQHPIETAQAFLGAKVLAVDLSLSSLAYAKRKTLELGLNSIEYAHADLTRLGTIGRKFDVIESSGVLHHLANPWDGWRTLLGLLHPGGFMQIGLYSKCARRDVIRIRTLIKEQGIGSTADEIRRYRQKLVDLDVKENFGVTLQSADFFTTSECRDLLFHAQEHQITLTAINTFLMENSLTFLGFEIDENVLHAYLQSFPDDHSATNLDNWQIFEKENPDIFLGMYQFWVQKAK